MKFDYNEEQQLLADSVRRFVAQDYSFEARRKIVASRDGCSAPVWATIADLGLLGLPFPSAAGGFGGGAVDLMSAMEAFGDALVVEPYLSTVMAAQFVARAGSAAQKERVLPAVIEGRLRMAFAQGERDARYDLSQVNVTADGSSVSGEKLAVMHAPVADELVVSARSPSGIGLYLVDAKSAGVSMRSSRTLDEMPIADVTFKSAPATPIGARDGLALIEEVVDFATALVCAEAVGAMKYANDATLEYIKARKQFGVPIGSFQALQHRMVDMVISYEQAKSMASLACAKVDSERDPAERRRVVSAAKIKIADASRHVSQESVQLHGGMGMSDELKVSHTFRRLTAIARQFGDADHHLARFAR
ncbi:MAG: acyl-CoA dehydrogenase [Usitatibacter sp.]